MMTEAEERELRIAIMQADLKLKTKQGFWETPRNIALIVAATATVAGVLGFKLGQHDNPPPPQTIIIQQQPPAK